MSHSNTSDNNQLLAAYCIRLGDTSLILGQRLAEWCGHGPILEEDIALTNISLDLIGQTRGFYSYACSIEAKGRKEDDVAYLRDDRDFRNVLLAEQPNGDFGQTILRQFLISAFQELTYQQLLQSNDVTLAALAGKSLKEVRYHLRHSYDWLLRLGQGTEESVRRMRGAIDELWPYVEDLFDSDELEKTLAAAGLAVDSASLRTPWFALVGNALKEAGLQLPEKHNSIRGSRQGKHSEHLGHLLAEMQMLHRSFPGAEW